MKYYLYDTVTGLFFGHVVEKATYTLTKGKSRAYQFDSIKHAQDFHEGNNLPDDFIVKAENE